MQPKIKCLVCEKRFPFAQLTIGLTCLQCTDKLTETGDELKQGESIKSYVRRIDLINNYGV